MKTITIDDKKIEISDESYEAFKKQFVTEDKAILWKPKSDDKYWSINTEGEVDDYTWYGNGYADESEAYDFELGNIFKTREEAQEALDTGWVAKRKAEVKILRFIAENDLEFEPDWDNSKQIKHFIRYNYSLGKLDVDYWSGLEATTGCFHFKSKKDAQKVIDAMTPELKILFGVKG